MKVARIGLCLIAVLFFVHANAAIKNEPLVGLISQQQVLTANQVFQDNYTSEEVSTEDLTLMNDISDSYELKVVFGSWCHDSEREIPRLIKLLENHPSITMTFIGVDKKKQAPLKLYEALKVKYTPTIIVFKDEKEIGRIVEKPAMSLGQDLFEIMR